MAGKLIINPLQLNDSSTATNNFVLKADNAGGVKLSRGNDGATTQDLLSVDSSGNVKLTKTTSTSMVRLNPANGYGSTNTKFRRFTNVVTNQGADITYADSATLGASFTINTNGVYSISYSDNFTSSNNMGITLNDSQGTAVLGSTNISNILTIGYGAGAGQSACTAWSGYLPAGSVITAKSDGVGSSGSVTGLFTITRVA